MPESGFYRLDVNGVDILGPAEPYWAWRVDGIVPGWYTSYEPCQGWYGGTDENVARAKIGVNAVAEPRGLGWYRIDPDSGEVVYSSTNVTFSLLKSQHEYYQSMGWDDPENGVSMWHWNYFETTAAAYAYHNIPLPPPVWAPATAYEIGDIVLIDGWQKYVCTQAGTSDEFGQGPKPWMGDTGIMDGTVIWDAVLV